jgi:hypothetical protein
MDEKTQKLKEYRKQYFKKYYEKNKGRVTRTNFRGKVKFYFVKFYFFAKKCGSHGVKIYQKSEIILFGGHFFSSKMQKNIFSAS